MKNNRKQIYIFLVSLLALAIILGVIATHGNSEKLSVVFLNVGQGDSILISKGSQQVLIDGGKDGKLLLEKLGKYIPFWDREIEVVIETHPDQDHIGGLIDVLKRYKTQAVVKTNVKSESQTFKKLEEEIERENVQVVEAKIGNRIIFSDDAIMEILFPFEDISGIQNDTNSTSVVTRLVFGNNSFLFTGDLPTEKEEGLILNPKIKSDVLKVSHHGSKYSTSENFLKAVSPRDAIISVGNNSYGHPNQDVLQRLMKNGIKTFRTDEVGDIVYYCESIKTRCELQNL